MKAIKTIISLALLLFILPSCQDKGPSRREIREGKTAAAKKMLVERHGITQDLDTIEWKYSVDLQDAPSDLFVCSNVRLHDLVRIDSAIHAIIVLIMPNGEAYFHLKASNEQVVKLKDDNAWSVLAFRLSSIRKVRSTLETECGEDHSYTYTEASRDFIGTGELLDVVSVPYEKD